MFMLPLSELCYSCRYLRCFKKVLLKSLYKFALFSTVQLIAERFVVYEESRGVPE